MCWSIRPTLSIFHSICLSLNDFISTFLLIGLPTKSLIFSTVDPSVEEKCPPYRGIPQPTGEPPLVYRGIPRSTGESPGLQRLHHQLAPYGAITVYILLTIYTTNNF